MATPSDEPLPAYIAEALPDKTIWQRLELRFSEYWHLAIACRLEALDEARGIRVKTRPGLKKVEWADTAPRWFDNEVGQNVRAWNLIPYIAAVDQKRLHQAFSTMKRLGPGLRQALAARAMTPTFLMEWGQFCAAGGAVELIYFSRSDEGGARAALAGSQDNLDPQRRWFANYFVRAYRAHPKVALAKRAVEMLVQSLTDVNSDPPEGWDVTWFERFLNLDVGPSSPLYNRLTKEFRERLTKTRLIELAAEPTDGLPPLDLHLPVPTP